MLFTEPAFLFLFLPSLFAAYLLISDRWRNLLLTLASLLFYGLGELHFLPLLVASIGINYFLAIWIEKTCTSRWNRVILALGIASDLALLVIFKYAGWFVENLDQVLELVRLSPLKIPAFALPLGISFFTFHKISYKIDVFRGVTPAQRNPITLALYILFFPQLIAGPIVRYHELSEQLNHREVTLRHVARGVRRVIVGLSKKVIIANSLALAADRIFQVPAGTLGPAICWTGIVCYTLQIYFDFSGYSDMAIGFALFFGFRFPENFDHPYTSLSISDFWRKWHISLSRWFRDYLYLPLGGNQRGNKRTYVNLFIVFIICGLWHGASFNFLVWGLFHGLFLVLERVARGRSFVSVPWFIRRCYTMLVVMIGWVFFRTSSLEEAVTWLRAMGGHADAHASEYSVHLFLDPWMVAIAIIAATLALFPVEKQPFLRRALRHSGIATPFRLASAFGLFALLSLSLVLIAAGTYSPFLYFRF